MSREEAGRAARVPVYPLHGRQFESQQLLGLSLQKGMCQKNYPTKVMSYYCSFGLVNN
jgi:hypothetical protein